MATTDALTAYAKRIQRRDKLVSLVTRALTPLRVFMFAIGYLWLLGLPTGLLGRGTYIDENALGPAQVKTNWDWKDVHKADLYLGEIEKLWNGNATSERRALWLRDEFEKLGLRASVQPYVLKAKSGAIRGFNSYAILRSPRTSGTEAMVISASWISRIDDGAGQPNLRGVAFLLALSQYVSRYTFWAKDIVFVVSDGYLDGMQAWLSAYHGAPQSNLVAEPLDLPSGVIWTALSIDYPGHSFSHLGIFFEGTNGRLPNQDLINSGTMIARYAGGIPVILYDHPDLWRGDYRLPVWIPEFARKLINKQSVKEYQRLGKNIWRHVKYQAQGKPSGTHGLFHKYRIDAITLFGLPALGPHGFHSLGKAVESTMRTMNNLLERLHASFFFYVFSAPSQFLQLHHYLPPPIIISVAMSFGGLALYVWTGWERTKNEKAATPGEWRMRYRPIMEVLCVMAATHIFGGMVFLLTTSGLFIRLLPEQPILSYSLVVLPTVVFINITEQVVDLAKPPQTAALLKAFNLCWAGMIIAVTAVVNFSLSAATAVLLGISLSVVPSTRSNSLVKLFAVGFLVALTPQGIMALLSPIVGFNSVLHWARSVIWDYEVVGSYFVPFVWMVYLPLVLQGILSCILT